MVVGEGLRGGERGRGGGGEERELVLYRIVVKGFSAVSRRERDERARAHEPTS